MLNAYYDTCYILITYGDIMATYYLNYFLTCIFLSSFSRILVWLLLKLTQTSEMLVITTIHIVAI